MDHGRCVASGPGAELKAMICTGETVTVEAVVLNEEQMSSIRRMAGVFETSSEKETRRVKFENAGGGLLLLLHYLEQEDVRFARVFAEQPTLNDVFLEITGKELRD